MNLDELNRNIQHAFCLMKEIVISNKSDFPSFHFDNEGGEETINGITCFVETDPSKLKDGLDTISGLCYKEEGLSPYRNEIKKYDIMVNVIGIAGGIAYIRNGKAKGIESVAIVCKDKDCEVIITPVEGDINITLKYDELQWPVICLVAHEFMHAISVGFANINHTR